MRNAVGMPLAIVACFLIGLLLTLLASGAPSLAAFFLAVGVTCLTYSYLGGQLDSKGAQGSGVFGVLSFKLTGSIVTFLVSFLFLNHHLGVSSSEDELSLKTGPDDILVQDHLRQLGTLNGDELEKWVSSVLYDDYFHPALILARRPYCNIRQANCARNGGFYAVADQSRRVPEGSLKLCSINDTNHGQPSVVQEIFTDAGNVQLLSRLDVQGVVGDRLSDEALRMRAAYADSGSLISQCRGIGARSGRRSQPIRFAALLNPADMNTLHPGGGDMPVVIKITFTASS